jgi:uncharacterized membrane protein YhaH (DUF805 family)
MTAGVHEMNPVRDWFTLHGRLNRAKFWIAKILCTTLGIALGFATYFIAFSIATTHYGPLIGISSLIVICFLVLVQIALVWVSVAIDIKRLHDLNLSGWWVAVLISCWTVLVYAAAHQTIELNMLRAMLLLYSVLYFAILGGWKGTAGDNKYGPEGTANESTGEIRFGPKPIYRKSEQIPSPRKDWFAHTPLDPTTRSKRYYAIINHAVSQLDRQDSTARADLYDKARAKLFHELRRDGRWDIKWEWNALALEKAIRKVEAKRAIADRQQLREPPSDFASEQMSTSTRSRGFPNFFGIPAKTDWE